MVERAMRTGEGSLFDSQLKNAWISWNDFCGYDGITMGLTITFFGLLAPTIRYIADVMFHKNSQVNKRHFLTIPEYLFLIDYAFEFPLMILNTPLGTPYSSREIPSYHKILLQTFVILTLERTIYAFIPLFPQDPTPVGERRRPATYNITSKEYVAPRGALFMMVFAIDFSTTAVEWLGRVHILALGLFLFLRGLIDGGEAGNISW